MNWFEDFFCMIEKVPLIFADLFFLSSLLHVILLTYMWLFQKKYMFKDSFFHRSIYFTGDNSVGLFTYLQWPWSLSNEL